MKLLTACFGVLTRLAGCGAALPRPTAAMALRRGRTFRALDCGADVATTYGAATRTCRHLTRRPSHYTTAARAGSLNA